MRRRGKKEKRRLVGRERELRRERWRVTFSDGIWFSTIFPTRVTALWPSRACWDYLRPSLSYGFIFRFFLSLCLFLLWPFVYTNSITSFFCPCGASTHSSGFMLCDGFTFSSIMSLSSSSFRVFSHVTIYQDCFFLRLGHFSSPLCYVNILVSVSLYLYRQSPLPHKRFAPSYFCFGSLHIMQRQLCVISDNKSLSTKKKTQLKAFRHVVSHCHFWSMTESLKYFAVFFSTIFGTDNFL